MWVKGQSGNPKGRPKKTHAMTEILERTGDVEVDGKTRKEIIADKVWELAEAGDMVAIKYIYDRIEGAPTNRHEMEGVVNVTFASEDEEL